MQIQAPKKTKKLENRENVRDRGEINLPGLILRLRIK